MVEMLLFQNTGFDSISGVARKSPVCKIVRPHGNLKMNITAPGQLEERYIGSDNLSTINKLWKGMQQVKKEVWQCCYTCIREMETNI